MATRHKVKLTEKKERWLKQRSDALVVGEPLAYPEAPAQRYAKKMRDEIQLMVRDYARAFKALDEELRAMDSAAGESGGLLASLSKKWQARFRHKAKEWVDVFTEQVSSFATKNTENSLKKLSGGITIKTPKMPVGMETPMRAATNWNVGLIQTIPQQFHDKIEAVVYRSMQPGGESRASIFDEIMKTGQVTEKRAELIARDQTRKLTTAFNLERMKSAGVKKLRWLHSGGGAEPRELHLRLDGQVFDIDDPPIIDERTGERGWGGQLINCRCKMVPVIDYTDTE